MALDSSKRIKSMTPTASGKNIGINATEEQPLVPREPTGHPPPAVNVMILTVLLQSLGFSIVLPSLKFYLEYNNCADLIQLGVVVASYSLGQFIGSPMFGYWSNVRPTAETLFFSLLVSGLGNAWYATVYLFPYPFYHLVASRFVIGFAAGIVSVCRAYVSHAVDVDSKRAVMAKMSAAQGVGFVLGPAVGAALGLLGKLNLAPYWGPLDYSSVGWLSAVISVLNFALVLFFFVEIPLEHIQPISAGPTPLSEKISVFSCIWMFATVIFNFAVFETMVTTFTSYYYGWKVVPNGILLGGAGLISIVVYIIIGLPAVKRWGDRPLLMVGLILTCGSLVGMGQFSFVPGDTTVYLPQFLAAAVVQSIGYPIASSLLYTTFAKSLNPRAQGGKMGWLTAGGSLARMLGPVFGVLAWNRGKATPVAFGTAAVVGTSIVVLAVCWRWLVPHPEYEEISNPDPHKQPAS
jgi:MFS family permease